MVSNMSRNTVSPSLLQQQTHSEHYRKMLQQGKKVDSETEITGHNPLDQMAWLEDKATRIMEVPMEWPETISIINEEDSIEEVEP